MRYTCAMSAKVRRELAAMYDALVHGDPVPTTDEGLSYNFKGAKDAREYVARYGYVFSRTAKQEWRVVRPSQARTGAVEV